jgi:hypothetical protein
MISITISLPDDVKKQAQIRTVLTLLCGTVQHTGGTVSVVEGDIPLPPVSMVDGTAVAESVAEIIEFDDDDCNSELVDDPNPDYTIPRRDEIM